MTALHAAGGGLSLAAFRIPHVVEQAGSIAGFAAVVGLAILSALYFSQARDLRRLREWAGRAPERAAEGQPAPVVPGRVVAVPQQQHPAPPAAAPAAAATTTTGDAAKPEQPAAAATNGDAAPSVAAADGDKGSTGDGDEAKDGEAPAAKPGMPAPASAAAAAGAGTKSVGAPGAAVAAGSAAAATTPGSSGAGTPAPAQPGSQGPTQTRPPGATPSPGQPGAPGSGQPNGPAAAAGASGGTASPQRPPGSVLPPRTGTLPPVRRLPSSNVGPAQTGITGQEPPKKKRNPIYVVLAVAGVLVLGAAAAVGVPALVNGSKDDNSKASTSSKTTKTASTKTAAAAVAPNKITVAVLNGTSIPGLAAQVGDRVDAEGFTLGTVSNASPTSAQHANSVALYSPGHQRDASRVAKKL